MKEHLYILVMRRDKKTGSRKKISTRVQLLCHCVHVPHHQENHNEILSKLLKKVAFRFGITLYAPATFFFKIISIL
jgi:hypothetical protein